MIQIEPYEPRHLDDVVDLSLRAWAPVFVSVRESMDRAVYDTFYPDGWEPSQREAVTDVCRDADMYVWVSLEASLVTGFVAIKQHSDTYAEIYMIAVDPEYHRRGIATALTEFALDWMRRRGISIAMVETGADPGHGPARRTYEKAGFGLMPVARYFKKL